MLRQNKAAREFLVKKFKNLKTEKKRCGVLFVLKKEKRFFDVE